MTFADGAIAGAVAGGVVESVLYPIDTIKTRLQVSLYAEYASEIFSIEQWSYITYCIIFETVELIVILLGSGQLYMISVLDSSSP